VGDATIFMSDPTAVEAIGRVLEGHGMEKTNNSILYDGASGKQIETSIFMGPVYGMRLKHMTEDKWNARAEGRREQKTHQPTGGRGAQGGLRIGEMERDALAGHGISGFLKESMMERADKTSIRICNGCGTVPIYNDKQTLMVCSLCDGPVGYIGTNASNMEILPPIKKSIATTSIVEMPYATKLLADELGTYLNMGMRIVTGKGLIRFNKETPGADVADANIRAALSRPLPERIMPETRVPEFREIVVEEVKPAEEDLYAMGVVGGAAQEVEEAEEQQEPPVTQNASVEQRLKEFSEANSKVQLAQATARLAEANVQVAQAKEASVAASAPSAPPLQQQQQMPPIVQQGGYYPTNSASTQPMGIMAPMGHMGPMGPMGQMQMAPQTYMVGGGQIMMGGQMPMNLPPPTPMAPMAMPMIYNSPIPNGPPTVVIDTRPPTMQGEYMEDQGYANAGMPVMGSNRRHTTPRNRQQSPERKGVTFAGGPIATSQRITVSKI
jgi:hypothetical protein